MYALYSSFRLPLSRLYVELSSLNIDAVSPTCLRSETSWNALSRLPLLYTFDANPWDNHSLMTADCYWRGSEELDRRFKCRYTSVPYLVESVSTNSLASDWFSGRLPFHGNQLQITTKVARIESRNRQSVSKTGHRRLEIAFIEVRVQVGGPVDSRVHVRPDQRYRTSGNTAAFVRDLDRDILSALGNNDLGNRELLLILAMCFDDGAQGVLQGLEEHV